MKHKLFAALLAGAVLFAGAAAGAAAAVPSAAPAHLLVLGDSIASGYGLPAGSPSYGAQLASAFGLKDESGYVNLAVPGTTSSDWKTALATGTPSSLLPAVKSADVILLSVGGNDVLGPFIGDLKTALGLPDDATSAQIGEAIASAPDISSKLANELSSAAAQARYAEYVDGFGANLPAIAASVKAANPKARLYIQTVYNPFDGLSGYDALAAAGESVLSGLNTIITANAAPDGYSVLDVHGAFAGRAAELTNISSGDIHPNADGHTAIFELAYQAITGRAYGSSSPSSAASSSSPSASSASSGPGGSSAAVSRPASGTPTPGGAASAAVSSAASAAGTGASSWLSNPPTGGSPLPAAAVSVFLCGAAAALLLLRGKRR